MLAGVVVVACALATVLAGARWLRVAQREHYLTDSASRFAARWWSSSAVNVVGLVIGAGGLVLATRWPAAGLATAAVVAVGPVGLGLRGRTAPLAWTRRLRTLAGVWVALQTAAVVAGILAGVGPVVAAAGALAVPALVDGACALTAPVERRLAGRFVARASERLGQVAPLVVAITGSYGKTSTKGYVTHLLGESMAVVASPASFNNRAGLARTVNEHLADGTDVLVAEMGTYRRGEIAELCTWVKPDVAVITAIGPVHLERFVTEDAIVEAKSEILTRAECAVMVVDDPRLSALSDRCTLQGMQVWRVSTSDRSADVCALLSDSGLSIWVRGEPLVGDVVVDARPGNVGCAVAVAVHLGVPDDVVARRLASLPTAPHRLEPAPTAAGGCLVLDDTYNANPAGARAALDALAKLAPTGGRRVVVTPGMVELGRRQSEENALFAAEAARVATDLVVVGRTNRRSLLAGAGPPPPAVALVRSREGAVAWVRDNLGEGDVALFENDLPDHYP
ncbi:MAG: Mur ligase family protein [Acidimicrobiales bacterium]